VRSYCSGVHLDSRPLALAAARGNYIGFNHIHDMPRNGIFAFRNQGGNVFEANLIHDVIQRTNDGGGIHLASMNPLCAPTAIMDNRIYRIGYQGGATNASISFGIYPDWFTSRMLIKGNIVADTRDGGIRLLGGDDAVIEDNIVGDDPMASIVFGRWNTASVRGIVVRNNTVVNGRGQWLRYYLGQGGGQIDNAIADPTSHFRAAGNIYWGRGTGGGLVVTAEARHALQDGDRPVTLEAWQAAGTEQGSTVRDPGATGAVDYSADPARFGEGSDTMRRMARPRPVAEAKAWLNRLHEPAAFVIYYDEENVRSEGDWQANSTKITDFLAFADLKQLESSGLGASVHFSAELAEGMSHDVYVRWYGAPAGRAAELEIEFTSPGEPKHTIRIDHRQEAHKWLRVGQVRPQLRGKSTLTVRSLGGGTTAIHSVAWKRADPIP
jgi:hypothetical protein